MAPKTGAPSEPSSSDTDSSLQIGAEERRSGRERRGQPTPALSSFWGNRRRRSGRRKGESDRTYVDTFSPRDVALLLGIFVLNIFDAFFTLLWIQRGGSEANPFMAFLLEIGEGAFLLQKCIVVGVWLIVLVIHKNFRLARIGLYSLAGVYSLLILGHFALIASDVSPQRQTLEPNSQISNEASDQRGQRRFGPQGTNPQADSL
jgi:hypothetical protein